MNIGRQWEDRLRIWAEQFPKHYFSKTDSVCLEYFTTFSHLSLSDAMGKVYSAAPVGTRWAKSGSMPGSGPRS